MLLMYETWFIIVMLIICPPFGLVLMVKNSFWDKKKQILAGIASILLFGMILFGVKNVLNARANQVPSPNEHGGMISPSTTPNNEVATPMPTGSPVPTGTETTPTPTGSVSPTVTPTITPTPTESPIVNEDGGFENYTLSEDQIAKLTDKDKYLYLLGKDLHTNQSTRWNLSIRSVNQAKYDLVIEAVSAESISITNGIKILCEKIYHLGYKSKTMQIALKIGGEIATVADYSSEIIPKIQCSVFENKEVIKKIIIIDVN